MYYYLLYNDGVSYLWTILPIGYSHIGTLSEFSSWYQDGKNKRFAVVFNFY